MKKFYEEPVAETMEIMDVISDDEMGTPDEGSQGNSDGLL